MRIFLVDQLPEIDPAKFAGDQFVTPDGGVYTPMAQDQLGGFWTKLGEIAGNIGGSFIGDPKLGTALVGSFKSSGGNSGNAKYMPQINQYLTDTDNLIGQADAGQITGDQAQAQLVTLIQNWENFKFSVPSKDQGFLYQEETQYLKPKWDAATPHFAQLTQQAATIAAQTASTSSLGGISTTTLLIAGIAIFFLFRR